MDTAPYDALTAPDLDLIERLARAAIDSLPDPYRDAAQIPPCAGDCPAAAGCRGPCPDHPECAPCPVTEAPAVSEFRMA